MRSEEFDGGAVRNRTRFALIFPSLHCSSLSRGLFCKHAPGLRRQFAGGAVSPAKRKQSLPTWNAGKKVAELVGHGCLGATDNVIAVTDRLGGGIVKSWLGKAVVPDNVQCVHHREQILDGMVRPAMDLRGLE